MAVIERPGLTQRLAAAAADEILAHQAAIERDGAEPRSLHLELSIGTGGSLSEVCFWTEHRVTMRRQLGLGKGSA